MRSGGDFRRTARSNHFECVTLGERAILTNEAMAGSRPINLKQPVGIVEGFGSVGRQASDGICLGMGLPFSAAEGFGYLTTGDKIRQRRPTRRLLLFDFADGGSTSRSLSRSLRGALLIILVFFFPVTSGVPCG